MTIQEIIKLLADVRTELWILKKTITSEDIKKELKYSIAGIDVVGCELSQNIAKKLKENPENK